MREFADDHHAGRDADAYAESLGRRPQLAYGLDQLQACRDGPLGIVLLGHRITEIRKNAIAEISRDQTAAGFPQFSSPGADKVASVTFIEILGIEALGERYSSRQDRKTSR